MNSFKLASFPNSRIKPRGATTSAFTIMVPLPGGNVPYMILPVDLNRTYVTIRNPSTTTDVAYQYAAVPGTPPATYGFQIKAGEVANDLESPQEIWFVNPGVATITLQLDIGDG